MKLAEQVDVTQSNLPAPFTIEFGPDDSVTVEPLESSKPVIIEVQNDIDELRRNPDMSPCMMQDHYNHYKAYRWFYRLAPEAARQDIEHHYIPCKKGSFGPPKCPMRVLFIKKDGH